MTEKQIGIAHRLAAAKWWTWLPGMAAHQPAPDGLVRVPGPLGARLFASAGCVPDLCDDATTGVLLGLLRTAPPLPTLASIHPPEWGDTGVWRVSVGPVGPRVAMPFEGATLGEALARALLEVRGG